MSNATDAKSAGDRDWQSLFAPPPPPPLPEEDTDAEQAPGDSSRPQPDTDPGPEPDPGPEQASEPGPPVDTGGVERPSWDTHAARHLQVAPEPAPTAGQPASPPMPVAAVPATEAELRTGEEKRQAAALRDVLGRLGVRDLVITRVRPVAGGRSYDIDVTDPAHLENLTGHLSDLARATGVVEARLSWRQTDTQGRIHLLDDPAAHDRGKSVGVWVPVQVRDAVRAAQSTRQQTASEVFLEAFNRQYHRLPTMFTRRVTVSGPMPSKPLSRRRREIDTSVQLFVYLNGAQLEVLDDTLEQYQAGSRSALVTSILAADLGVEIDQG